MKKLFIILFLLFYCNQATYSQRKLGISLGYKNDGFNRVGPNGDKFTNGSGISLELASNFNSGVSMGIFSFDYYRNTNILKGSEVTCSYITIYYLPFDWKIPLYYNESNGLKFYLGASLGNQFMRVENTHGVDYSWLLTGSVGFQYGFSSKTFFQIQARPYLTFFNQLRPSSSDLFNGNGLELKISIGVYK